jgi:hypothetical protein
VGQRLDRLSARLDLLVNAQRDHTHAQDKQLRSIDTGLNILCLMSSLYIIHISLKRS